MSEAPCNDPAARDFWGTAGQYEREGEWEAAAIWRRYAREACREAEMRRRGVVIRNA